MRSLERSERLSAFILSGAAGFVDAIGFIATKGFFVSFMSGNSTRAGVGIFDDYSITLTALGLILAFICGVTISSFAVRRTGIVSKAPMYAALAIMIALSATAFLFGFDIPAIALLAVTMGATNMVFATDGDVRFGLTYMTGALVKIGNGIGSSLAGGPNHDWPLYAILWSSLITGVLAGAACAERIGMQSLWIVVAVLILLAGFSKMRRVRS